MYALVEIKGKQYKAEKGSLLKVETKGESVDFSSVLLLKDEEKVKVGTPYVDGAKIKAVVEEHGKSKKVIVRKFKRRKNYRRKQGHRQQFTIVRVEDIVGT
jgi:large subunit ribosomal protein L21